MFSLFRGRCKSEPREEIICGLPRRQYDRKRAEIIELTINSSDNDEALGKLRRLALTDGGLLTNQNRRLAWPKLLGMQYDDYSSVLFPPGKKERGFSYSRRFLLWSRLSHPITLDHFRFRTGISRILSASDSGRKASGAPLSTGIKQEAAACRGSSTHPHRRRDSVSKSASPLLSR